jgi:MscS family membrane protein
MLSLLSPEGAVPEWLEPLHRALVQTTFLEVDLWRWLVLAFLFLISVGLAWAGPTFVAAASRRLFPDGGEYLASKVAHAAVGPARLLVGVLVFSAGTPALMLPEALGQYVSGLQRLLVILAAAWLALRVIDVLVGAAESAFARDGRTMGLSVASLGRRTAKLLVAAVALLALLRAYGLDVTGVIAGLGIGGLAVALAAQKSIENLFGGVTLVLDQPVRVGEFCRFGEKVGTVEEVGLRSTRIRTLDRTVVTIPNAEFSSMQLENFTRRDRFWLNHVLGLRYETSAAQMRRVMAGIRQVLLDHPKVHPDPARVRFVAFGDFSLNVDIFAYVLVDNMNDYLEVQQDLLLSFMDVVADCGTGFAFPSQTIYAAADGGIAGEARQSA